MFTEEELLDEFKKFVEEELKSYAGRYRLDFVVLVERFLERKEYESNTLLLGMAEVKKRDGSKTTVAELLKESFNTEEYLTRFKELTRGYVSEENVYSLILNNLNVRWHKYCSEEKAVFFAAKRMGFEEAEERGWYAFPFPKEVQEVVEQALSSFPEGRREEEAELTALKLGRLLIDVAERRGFFVDGNLKVKDLNGRFYVYVEEGFLLQKLHFNVKKVAEEMLRSLKRREDYSWALDLERYAEEHEDEVFLAYADGFELPKVGEVLEVFFRTVPTVVRKEGSDLKKTNKNSLKT